MSQKTTDFSSLVPKVTPSMSVVVLPWQVAANAQQFGRNLAQQHKKAVIFGTDGLFSPGTFTINGSYVSSFGPDITAIPADKAIAARRRRSTGTSARSARRCSRRPTSSTRRLPRSASRARPRAGATCWPRSRRRIEPTSILGQPIKFDSNGDLINGKFFLFKIDSSGKYNLITG